MIIKDFIFPYDYIVLTLFLLLIILCFWRGFIQSILSLLTWVGSILVTIYSYENFSNYISKMLLKIKFFQNFEYLTFISSIIISIPVIFIITLFILKKIRNFLSSELDKKILGIILDKFFGALYGILFYYTILSSIIILFNRFEYNSLNMWLKKNSHIIYQIDNFNKNYIYLEEVIDESELD